jgi:hypothetical protein
VNSRRNLGATWSALLLLLLTGFCFTAAPAARGAGVTLITHGYNGNVTDWVIPMANRIPRYASFPGTNVSAYEISITRTGSVYYISQEFLDGESPFSSDSGEITIALDWSTLSSGTVPTTAIATQVAAALLATNLIPDLHGHALAELPLHLVGHSRGASVITEAARVLGAQGLWVDHVTTLDPYPVSLFGDPSMKNYANILFADNYWQNLGFPSGQAISGAYNRQLTILSGGGYSGTSPTHSDVHLWYHGTIDLVTPTSDTQASITSAMRTSWWTTLEAAGTNAGFLYSRIGEGNRLSSLEPAGAGKGRISDGMNKVWDLGAGLAANRSSLPADNGAWPNLIRLDVAVNNPVPVGQPVPFSVYHQFGSNTLVTATFRLCLDPDANPYNGNETVVVQSTLAGTGTNLVTLSSASFSPNPATTLPGTYAVFAQISAGPYTRYLYAPEQLVLTPSQQAPVLVGPQFLGNQFQCTVHGLPGQTVIVQGSTNMTQWMALQTNTLGLSAAVAFSDPASGGVARRFYRAALSQ